MQANMSSNSVTIALELGDGSHVPFELSSRMRRRCFVLSAIPPGAILRGVQFEPFRAVMNYLDSGECPPNLHRSGRGQRIPASLRSNVGASGATWSNWIAE